LLESYVPGLDEWTAAAITSRVQSGVRQLVKEGKALRWLRSFALVGEETYLCVVAAIDADEAVEVNVRARIGCDHVVEVVTFDPSRSLAS
jgi:hypothetical protein